MGIRQVFKLNNYLPKEKKAFNNETAIGKNSKLFDYKDLTKTVTDGFGGLESA
jgi:hypothetical protein